MWNLANGLTLSRFVTAPIFLIIVLQLRGPETASLSCAALVLVVITLLTDMFDGIAARSLQEVTDFGKIMDPVADSTFFLTALLALSASDRFAAPLWAPLIVLYREIAMHVLRRYAALRGIVLAAKKSGKAKMCIQSIGLVLLLVVTCGIDLEILPLSPAIVPTWTFWTMVVVVAVNLISLPEYLREIPRLRTSPPPES